MHDREYTVNKLPSPCERGLPLFWQLPTSCPHNGIRLAWELLVAKVMFTYFQRSTITGTSCRNFTHGVQYRLSVSEVVW